MSTSLAVALQEFKPDDYTSKALSLVFGALPFAPPFRYYDSLESAAAVLVPNAPPQLLDRARTLLASPEVESVLSITNAIDYGDAGISLYTGLRSAAGLFFGLGATSEALETDPQQAVDALAKALAISWMIHKAFPGSIPEKLKQFEALPAGQSLILYFAACEVALPFTDNLIQGGGRFIGSLMNKFGNEGGKKFAAFAGEGSLTEARGVFSHLVDPLEKISARAATYVTPMANKVKDVLPGALNVMDKATGLVATGLDALPVYRMLGARLATELVLQRAASGR